MKSPERYRLGPPHGSLDPSHIALTIYGLWKLDIMIARQVISLPYTAQRSIEPVVTKHTQYTKWHVTTGLYIRFYYDRFPRKIGSTLTDGLEFGLDFLRKNRTRLPKNK